MKIALISHLYPSVLNPQYGKFIQDQFSLLTAHAGIEVDLHVSTPYAIPFTKRWKKNKSPLVDQSENTKRFHYLSFPEKRFPYAIQKSLSKNLISELSGKNYDLIHLHWLYPDGMAIPALNELGYKTILTIHGSDWYQNYERPKLEDIAKDCLESVNRVLYSGPKLKTDAETKYPWLAKKSDVIFNAVNTDKYQPVSSEQKSQLRKQLNWDTSKTHVLTVANLRHEKGIDILFNAIKAKDFRSKNIQFWIIGNKDNSEYSNSILRDLKKPEFDCIQFLGPMPPDELIKYYQAADFYVLPSRREGFNVSILEAASCGLPLVCSDVGGNRQVIDLGVGLIFDSPKNLGDKIAAMVGSYKNYKNEKLHQIIEENFGDKAFTKRLIQNYKAVIKN